MQKSLDNMNLQICSELLGLKYNFILASESPRRKKLLEQLGFTFQVIPANIDENEVSEIYEPANYAKELAFRKAQKVANNYNSKAIILAADTIVVIDNKILNKPETPASAFEMLSQLSGRTHTVYTGIALAEAEQKIFRSAVKATEVTFRKLNNEEINAYIATKSPMDKAGAYGIQDDFGAVFVSHINGCYYNIVGLPLELLYTELRNFINEIQA